MDAITEFTQKVFNFDSNVKVTVTKEKVTGSAGNGSSTIESKNLESYHYIDFSKARLSSTALVFRTFAVGIVMVFISGDQWNALIFKASFFNIIMMWGGLLAMLIAVFAFFLEMIDMLLQLGLYNKLIGHLFSDNGYQVTIGNRSGNNIVFFAMRDELRRVKELDKKLEELKVYLTENKNPIPVTPVQQNTNDNHLDDLKKLGDLYQSGILTKEEFEQKKSSILNK